MSSTYALDLLDDIKQGSEEYEHAIFGTYSFDPSFFEGKLLPILQKRDTDNILVLVDPSEYGGRFDDAGCAGREYYLDYCACNQIFHPKFVLLIWREGGKLLIGSANLTERAWHTDGELLVNIEYSPTKVDSNAASAFWEMKQFLQQLAKKLLKSRKHQTRLDEALGGAEWLREMKARSSSKIRVLHNLEEPIIPQVLDIVGDEEIVQVDILSPFFDKDTCIIKRLVQQGCRTVHLYVQPKKVEGFPKKELASLAKQGLNVRVFSINFKDHETRYIHAKLLVIKTKQSSYCLVGSANLTRSAMLSTASNGNVELCVLRTERNRKYFDHTVDPRIFDIKEIQLGEVPTQPISRKRLRHLTELCITDAYIDHNKLIVEFEPQTELSEATITLWHHENEFRTYSAGVEEGSYIRLALDEPGRIFCSEPTYVTVKIGVNRKTLKSDRRWISTEILELTPRRRDIQRIQESDGRLGLIKLFNQLERLAESPEMFLYYLRYVDYDDLDESLDWVRKKLLGRVPDVDMNEVSLKDLPQLNPNEVFRKIMDRHRKRFERRISQTETSKLIEALKGLFNMFMFLNKVTLWFFLTGRSDITELLYIRKNLDSLEASLQRLRKETRRPLLQQRLEKLRVVPHIMLWCFIVDQIHHSHRYDANNKSVVRVFQDTYTRSLKPWLTDKEGTIDERALETHSLELADEAKEYEEFQNLKIEPENVTRFCREMAGRELHPEQDFISPDEI